MILIGQIKPRLFGESERWVLLRNTLNRKNIFGGYTQNIFFIAMAKHFHRGDKTFSSRWRKIVTAMKKVFRS